MANLCTAEISLYPLAEQYEPVIKRFIERLESYGFLDISISTTSTQVRGEYADVFLALAKEIEHVHAETGQAILVCKFLAGANVGVGLYRE